MTSHGTLRSDRSNTDIRNLKGPDIIFITRNLEASLWTQNRLERVLEFVYDANALVEVIRKENTTKSSKTSQSIFKEFTGPYLLIEEMSGSFRPVVSVEYPADYNPVEPPWPVLKDKTAFGKRATIEEEESEDQKENVFQPLQKSLVASGFFSGSAAQTALRQVSDNPALSKLTSRIGRSKRDREIDPEENEKLKRSKMYHVYPMVLQSKGFCENCCTKYEDYQKVSNS